MTRHNTVLSSLKSRSKKCTVLYSLILSCAYESTSYYDARVRTTSHVSVYICAISYVTVDAMSVRCTCCLNKRRFGVRFDVFFA